MKKMNVKSRLVTSQAGTWQPPYYREMVTDAPDVDVLREEFFWALQHRDANVFRRQRLNYNTRYCIWPGQSVDGRKWATADGADPFPWKGASDSRPASVDMLICQDVAKLMVIWRRMRVLVNPAEVNDDVTAARLTQVLRWMKYTQMKEAPRQYRLAANLFLERGAMVMGVFWEKARQMGYDEIDLEELKVMGIQAAVQNAGPEGMEPEPIVELPNMVLDPTREKEAADILAKLYPDAEKGQFRQVVGDLRQNGTAEFARPYVVKNRPTVVALATNEDIFCPPETTELQLARALHRREFLSETQLLDRVESHGWNADWVDEVIETQRGRATTDFEGNLFRGSSWRWNARGTLNTTRLYEIIHSYRRLHDKRGVPGIYCDVFSVGITSGVGYHDLLNYDHGQYPFVHFERETRSRLLDDSRGYGEIASTWQQQIKTEWDSRTDRASIATLPPAYYPPGEPPDAWGPGVKIPTTRPEDYGFMAAPEHDVGSAEVEAGVRDFMYRYFGRVVDEFQAGDAQVQQQDLAEIWMGHCGQVDTQVLQLMQQFMPDQFYYRVVGSAKAQPLHATREEIQGEFDVSVSYNTSDLDQERVKQKMDFMETLLQMDTTGRVDRDEVLTVAAELMDPNLAERILRPAQEASGAEIKDEKNIFSMMMNGIGSDVIPGHAQAYQMRLQTLMNIMRQNPDAQQKYQMDGNFRMLVDKRVKQLQFQLTEDQNARIGALGA